LDELRASIAAVQSNPRNRKQAIAAAQGQLTRLVQLIRVDLPRAQTLSKFTQDRTVFNKKELDLF
jgi:hypothetical protein